jgi:hypothetical protein
VLVGKTLPSVKQKLLQQLYVVKTLPSVKQKLPQRPHVVKTPPAARQKQQPLLPAIKIL